MRIRFRSLTALIILAFLFYFVGTEELFSVLLKIQFQYLLYLAGIAVVLIWISCVKWRLFIDSSGHTTSILYLMKLYTIGYFFNNFAPGSIAGDVLRSMHLGDKLSSKRDAFISTFLERFTGLVAMALLGLLFVFAGTEVTKGLELSIILVGLLTAILSIMLFSKKALNQTFLVVEFFLTKFGFSHLGIKIQTIFRRLDEGMVFARTNWILMAKAICLSFVYHILTVINTYCACYAIGWTSVELTGLFIVVPLVLIVSMAPITPGGLGIQEGAFLFLLQRIGATNAQGLAVGLLLRAKLFVVAIVGSLLWASIRTKVEVKNYSLKTES